MTKRTYDDPLILESNRCHRIYHWMKGMADEGGITSPVVAKEFGVTVRIASATLNSMIYVGRIAKVGMIPVIPANPRHKTSIYSNVFVRVDELEDYYDLD